ncbi:MAG TPA: XdhC/CoxI family protein [Synergistaceae bacterium]|nr:XdhC/CoxI family protein [Synergistaceae bacterium]HPJ25922.1 XdhC/CoxI family protein [Synergistaceae bacterium]
MIIVQEGFSAFEKVRECLSRGIPCVLCTVVESDGSTPTDPGSKMVVLPDGSITGTVGGGLGEYKILQKAREILSQGSESLLMDIDLNSREAAEEGAVCGGSMRVFLEHITPAPEIVIFGGGHVGKAILKTACFLGWRGILWDDREEFAILPEHCTSQAISLCCPLEEIFSRGLEFHENSFVLVATRGHALDAEVVRLLENHSARYFGMIGSRNKIRSIREQLLEEGISPAHLDRIYQPVGLPINAQTPEEIALSVMAEMVGLYRSAPLENLREKWGPQAVTPGAASKTPLEA